MSYCVCGVTCTSLPTRHFPPFVSDHQSQHHTLYQTLRVDVQHDCPLDARRATRDNLYMHMMDEVAVAFHTGITGRSNSYRVGKMVVNAVSKKKWW